MIKRFLKGLARLLVRLGYPCYGCVREFDCELYDAHGRFCGDWGLSYYEGKKDDGQDSK